MPSSRRASWAETFVAFPAGRIAIGPVRVNVVDWSRPQSGPARIFEHPWLERLSYAGPLLPALVYIPGGLALVWFALRSGVGAGTAAVSYVVGLLGWTAFEYLMHRFVFHYTPATATGVAVQYLIHGVHHAYPADDRRWMIPIGASLPIASAIVGAAWLVGPIGVVAAGGFVHGYLAYDVIHHEVHRTSNQSWLVRTLRAQHMRHHYATPDREFCVSSPLWDAVFGTQRTK